MSKKIALVGTAITSRLDAPFHDESWEIWTLGLMYELAPRFDLFFELHSPQFLKSAGMEEKFYEFLRKSGNKIIFGEPFPDCPEALLYPKDHIVAKYGKYFTSSVALMLAMAIEQSPEKIGIWGIDMTGSDEYTHQRSCCEYYLGIAVARGIGIVKPPECPLLRASRIYGLEYTEFSSEMVVRRNQLTSEINKCKEETKKEAYYQGQVDLINDIIKRW